MAKMKDFYSADRHNGVFTPNDKAASLCCAFIISMVVHTHLIVCPTKFCLLYTVHCQNNLDEFPIPFCIKIVQLSLTLLQDVMALL